MFNLVPGVGVSPDKMLQARLLAYQDAHRYRVGVNHNQIPVNSPRCPVNHYQRDGAMAGCPMHNVGQVQPGGANFYPNDRAEQGAPVPSPALKEPPLYLSPAALKTYDQSDEDYHSQAGDLFRVMNENQKQQLAANIASGLRQATVSVQERMLAQFAKADSDYAARVKTLL
jgi:catalase